MIKLPWVRSIIFGIFTAGFLVGSLSGLNQAFAASVRDCDNNAVIYCGVSTIGDLASKYNNGDGHNSAASIQHIYSWFGISSNDMQSLDTTAKNGKVTDKGNVYFGDDLVATDAVTGGRQNMTGSTAQSNQGTNFYSRPPSVSFQSQSLDAYVIMKNGVFQFAVLKSCGNPVKATAKPAPQPQPKPQPTPQPTPQPAPAPAAPQAAPQSNVCSGNTTNTNNGIGSQGGNCSINTTTVVQQTPATPSPPPSQPQTLSPSGQCDNLTISASPNNSSTPLTIQASVTYSTANGAQLKSIIYDFGDGTVSSPTTQTNMTHTYAQAGTYTIKATLEFTSGTTATTTASAISGTGNVAVSDSSGSSATLNSTQNVNASTASNTVSPAICQASVTVNAALAPPAPTPVTPTVTTTSASVTPTAAPQQLVNTGPGETAGMFIITSLLGTFGYRLYLRKVLA